MKRVLLFLFVLFIPLKANALAVTGLEVSAPPELKQWEISEVIVDLKFSRSDSEGLLIGLGAGIEVEYNRELLTMEGAKAANSEIYTQGGQGYRDVIGVFEFEEEDVSFETNCSNNVYCNNYRFVLQVYPRSSGSIEFTVRSPYMLAGDLSNFPNFTEDDIGYVDGSFEKRISLNVKAAPKPAETTEPIEITERPTTAITAPKISKIPTTKPKSNNTKTTTTTINSMETSISTESTTLKENKEDKKEDDSKDKEKNNLLYIKNKKVYFYGGIVIAIIILIIIVRLIINKIRNRKIDKVLKNL